MIVLDASLALAWLFGEDSSPEITALFDEANLRQLIVPPLWHLEVSNVLVIAERKGRITPAELARYVNDLRDLPITTADVSPESIRNDILPLAQRERLTVHDAAYLHLTMKMEAFLATLDADLRAAARRNGLSLLPDGN